MKSSSPRMNKKRGKWIKKKCGDRNKRMQKNPLKYIPYDEYLKTRAWKETRKKRLKMDNHQCQNCGDEHRLVVHHKTYCRRGREKMKDLITLCFECHNLLHEHGPEGLIMKNPCWTKVADVKHIAGSAVMKHYK